MTNQENQKSQEQKPNLKNLKRVIKDRCIAHTEMIRKKRKK
jgi:hypothetical protein